jgi:AcrR family transcriptional regulator
VPKVSAEYATARREQILSGARRCFARWGYEGATVARLEREIGLSHGAIFNYYRSKLDLFFELAKRDHERFHELWAEEGFGGLARHIAEEDPAWLSVYLEFHRLLRTDAALARRWKRRQPAEHHQPGYLRTDVPAETLHAFAHTVLNGLVLARTSGADLDVAPIVALVEETLSPRDQVPGTA